MDLFSWFLSLPQIFGDMINFLGTKVFEIGGTEVSFLALISGGVIFSIIIAKIVALAIPN